MAGFKKIAGKMKDLEMNCFNEAIERTKKELKISEHDFEHSFKVHTEEEGKDRIFIDIEKSARLNFVNTKFELMIKNKNINAYENI